MARQQIPEITGKQSNVGLQRGSHIIPKAGDAACKNKGDATPHFHCSMQTTRAVVPTGV